MSLLGSQESKPQREEIELSFAGQGGKWTTEEDGKLLHWNSKYLTESRHNRIIGLQNILLPASFIHT